MREIMTKALVVYESFFGNTGKIADAIAAGLSESCDTRCVTTAGFENSMLEGISILVAGSPTRGFQPAAGIKNFIKASKKPDLAGVRAAAFDTRIDLEAIESKFLRFVVHTGGYAAKKIARKLGKLSGQRHVPRQGFYVTGEEGPLRDGELERAEAWGKELAAEQA